MKKGLGLFVATLLLALLPVTAHADRFDRGGRYDRGHSYYRYDRPRSGFSFSFGFGGGYRGYPYTGFSYSRYYAPVYVRPAPVYIAPPVLYYEPAPVFYEPAVIYQPSRVYYYSEPCYPSYRPSFYFSTGYYYRH